MSWPNELSKISGLQSSLFRRLEVRRRYIKFLNSGIVHIHANDIAEKKRWSQNVYLPSFVIAPTKPVEYIKMNFHLFNK